MSKSKRVRTHHKARKHSKRRISRKHYRKHLSKKLGRKHRKRRVVKRTRKMRGGFGPAACPFPGTPWNAVNGGSFFSKGIPIGVGGTSPYFGETAPAPQTTQSFSQKGGSCAKCHTKDVGGGSTPSPYPFFPQSVTNLYRGVQGGLGNAILQYQGLDKNPSPLPESQNQWQV